MFNAKDALQARFLALCAGTAAEHPAHFLPSVHGFLEAARRGIGWGMVPAILARDALDAGSVVEIVPGRVRDVPLYWHCWRLDAPILKTLTQAVRRAAAGTLQYDAVGSAPATVPE